MLPASGRINLIWNPAGSMISLPRPAGLYHAAGREVAFAGFLTNEADVARRLGLAQGEVKCTEALISRAHERWGDRLPEHLRGVFACVIRRSDNGGTLAFTSAVGCMPLYYRPAAAGSSVRIATNIVDLLDRPKLPEIDEIYIADFLARGSVHDARTPFKGISRLLPGHSLSLKDGHCTLRHYWRLRPNPEVAALPDTAMEEALREVMMRAIAPLPGRFASAWCELSGGLDSSTVFCLAAQAGFARFGGWSVFDPNYPAADEREWIGHVTRETGIASHLVDISGQLPFSAEPGAFIGEPYLGVINTAQFQAKNALFAERGIDLLLTGFAGDPVLGALPGPFPVHLADPLFRFAPGRFRRDIADWAANGWLRRPATFWLTHCVVRPMVQHWRGQAISATPTLPAQPWIARDYRHRFDFDRRLRRRSAPRHAAPGEQHFADSIWTAALQASIERQRQRSFETIHPLLDQDLIDFMFAVPMDQRMRPRCDRFLQRRALKGVLPEPIRQRAGKAIGTPVFVEGLARSPRWVEFLVQDSAMVEMGIATEAEWQQSIDQATIGQTHGDQFLHAGIALEVWLKQLRSFATEDPAMPRESQDKADHIC